MNTSIVNSLRLLFFILTLVWSGDPAPVKAITAPCQTTGSPLSQISLQLEPFAKGWVQPLGMTHAGDLSNRLFIVEQKGIIWIIEDGKKRAIPFLDLKKKVSVGAEMGLLGLAFHPKFSENHRFFVHYTTTYKFEGIRSVIAEYKTGNKSLETDPKSERVFLLVTQPYPNHKGGNLAFGPDEYLYIGLGDGGSANDPLGNGQNLGTKLGKILRIDIDHPTLRKAYSTPPDNPFAGQKGALPEIWAYGLRNPWRYSFDSLTGLLYAGDVGQDNREEIDIIQKGKNYGWKMMEGTICTPGVNPKCDKRRLELPILDYGRSEGSTVIGGYVYRGNKISSLCGAYLYGDFGNGRVWGLRYNGRSVTEQHLLLETHRKISSFGEDENHELYLVDYDGEILRIGSK